MFSQKSINKQDCKFVTLLHEIKEKKNAGAGVLDHLLTLFHVMFPDILFFLMLKTSLFFNLQNTFFVSRRNVLSRKTARESSWVTQTLDHNLAILQFRPKKYLKLY